MSPITTAGSCLTLTARHIDDWSAAERALTGVDRWPTGHPASFSIPPLERAVPICRRLAVRWLDAERIRDETTRYTTLLILSELITNAIRHSSSSRVTSRLWVADDLIFVEVHDEGGTSSVPRVNRAGRGEDHGRGLALIASSARVWGTRLDADGSCTVWAAVPLVPGA